MQVSHPGEQASMATARRLSGRLEAGVPTLLKLPLPFLLARKLLLHGLDAYPLLIQLLLRIQRQSMSSLVCQLQKQMLVFQGKQGDESQLASAACVPLMLSCSPHLFAEHWQTILAREVDLVVLQGDVCRGSVVAAEVVLPGIQAQRLRPSCSMQGMPLTVVFPKAFSVTLPAATSASSAFKMAAFLMPAQTAGAQEEVHLGTAWHSMDGQLFSCPRVAKPASWPPLPGPMAKPVLQSSCLHGRACPRAPARCKACCVG